MVHIGQRPMYNSIHLLIYVVTPPNVMADFLPGIQPTNTYNVQYHDVVLSKTTGSC